MDTKPRYRMRIEYDTKDICDNCAFLDEEEMCNQVPCLVWESGINLPVYFVEVKEEK